MSSADPVLLFASKEETVLTTQKISDGKAAHPFERFFIDRNDNSYYKLAEFENGETVLTVDSALLSKQKFAITNETKTILGYKCRKATTSVNSNSIELWFTEALNIKGAPTELGQDLGLVLEMVRNGNYAITASKVEEIKSIPADLGLPKTPIMVVDELTYKDLLWKSRFIDLSIFKNEQINFTDEIKSDSILRFANSTIILKKVKVPVIKEGNNIFLELIEQSNGDAYDRTGSVFLIPTDQDISFLDGLQKGIEVLPIYENGNSKQYQGVVRTENYSPLVELMRFFTPFGVKQFNHIQLKGKEWQDRVSYRQDISEFQSILSNQEVWIGTFIGNYDKGGHKVSLNLTVHPGGQESVATGIIPLFNTNNVMEMAGQEYATMFDVDKGLEVTFTLDKDVKNAKLRYITTGHGGWGNGDEFVPKENAIFLNGTEVFSFTPWRVDCGSYRLYNPASGNFSNGLSSSDLSRSNWCPGTLTNPVFIDLGDLKAGKHTMRIKIPQGEPEGTSFSSWNVSGCLIVE